MHGLAFMFKLMTVGWLSTAGFQRLHIRTKVYLEHLEKLLYPTVLKIFMLGVKLPDAYQLC